MNECSLQDLLFEGQTVTDLLIALFLISDVKAPSGRC